MIIEFRPNKILASSPPQWCLYYKEENEHDFNQISLTYEVLKLFLEIYGYETNDILRLKEFCIKTNNIKQNTELK